MCSFLKKEQKLEICVWSEDVSCSKAWNVAWMGVDTFHGGPPCAMCMAMEGEDRRELLLVALPFHDELQAIHGGADLHAHVHPWRSVALVLVLVLETDGG
jgi:hypothetical protein